MYTDAIDENKTSTFQMRISPTIKAEAEKLFAECGMTLPEAVNVFLYMSLKTNGLPFQINRNKPATVSDQVFDFLDSEYRKGLESSKKSGKWYSEEEVRAMFRRSY